MTTASYPSQAAALKSSRSSIGGFEIIASGDVFPASDIVTASVVCHEVRGRLYRVVADAKTPNGFRRIRETPLALDIANSCLNRIPRKHVHADRVNCVPVWR